MREMSEYILELKGITKIFPGVKALDNVHFQLKQGEIHALMGENGAGGVDLGNGSAGLNPAAMMAGMALGGAVSHNIAGIMNNSMAGINQTTPSGATPPPVPVVAYHIAVNGQATGPF